MKRRTAKRILGGAAAAGLMLATMTAQVDAGPAPDPGAVASTFFTVVYGPDSATVLDGLSLEIFDGTVAPGATGADITATLGCTPTEKPGRVGAAFAVRGEDCLLDDDDDTYTIGVAGVPSGWNAAGFCSTNQIPLEALPGVQTTFTLNIDDYAICEIVVAPVDASMIYSVVVNGLGHEPALAGVEIEVYQDGALLDPLDCTAGAPAAVTTPYSPPMTGFGGSCDLEPTITNGIIEAVVVELPTYELGLSALPDGYTVVGAYCNRLGFGPAEQFDTPVVSFDIYPTEFGMPSTMCDVYIEGPPTVYVEHVVEGGPADTTDFTTQLFGGTGALAGESSDPSPDFCMGGYIIDRLVDVDAMVVADVCGAIVVPAEETYSVGAVLPDYGYEAAADCSDEPPFLGFDTERIVSDLTSFDHPYPQSNASLCVLTATYYEQTITVDVIVDNTAGGTSSDGSDIEVEVYDQDGTLVDSGFDPAPNSTSASAEFTLPIGDYTIGVSGPDGYTHTVVVTVVANDVTSTTVPVEIIDDPSANLSLTSQQTAAVELLATGQPAPTTTTTIAPTTTTIAPTTTQLGILPATGQSSTTDNLAWWALGLLGAGLLIARASRRPAPHAR